MIGQPVLACLGEHSQRHRGARHPVPAGVGEHAHQDLVGVQGPKDRVAAVEQCDQLAARELGQCGHRLEVRVGTIEQALGEDGQRRAEPTHPPRTAQLAHAGHRAQLLPDALLRFDLPGEAKIDRDMAGNIHDHVAVVHLLARRHAGEQHRLTHRVTQRRHPQIVLELGERLRERLRDRTRPIDRPPRHPANLRRHGTGLQQPQSTVSGDRPLDVLRAAERTRDVTRQRDETLQVAGRELRPVAAGEVDDPGVGVEHIARPVDLTAHERLGSTLDRGDHTAVAATRNRVDTEQHTAVAGLDQRLDQHRDR